MAEDIKKQYKLLHNKIKQFDKSYYQANTTMIADFEYDLLGKRYSYIRIFLPLQCHGRMENPFQLLRSSDV